MGGLCSQPPNVDTSQSIQCAEMPAHAEPPAQADQPGQVEPPAQSDLPAQVEQPGQLTLDNATWKNTKPFTFKDITVNAKVIKVYDGDTCTCVFDTFGLGLYRHNVRLNGIDTAEIKSANPDVKALAIRTRDFVAELILNKMVQLRCEGTDKYGRILGLVYYDGVSISDLLLEKKLAMPYGGGKKTEFTEADAKLGGLS